MRIIANVLVFPVNLLALIVFAVYFVLVLGPGMVLMTLATAITGDMGTGKINYLFNWISY